MPIEGLAPRNNVFGTPESDHDLMQGCILGREEDWNLLIEKYKKLIVSIPIRYGFSREESADIFQAVCFELIQSLPRLRVAEALPKWLIQVTSHKCYRWKRESDRTLLQSDVGATAPEPSEPANLELDLCEIEKQQILRETVAGLPSRCKELIRMLFYEEPNRPYREVAASLGLAVGTIGLLRQKCLDRLRDRLASVGFL